jgi:PKD repeat protein
MTNPFLNPSFETGDFTNWNYDSGYSGNGEVTNAKAYDGTYSAHFAPPGLYNWGTIQQNFDLGAGGTIKWRVFGSVTNTSLKITIHILADGGGVTHTQVYESTDPGSPLNLAEWTTIETAVAAIYATGAVGVMFEIENRGSNPQECWIDKIEFVVEPPIASFTSVQTGLSVAFTDTSTQAPTSWDWDFGDGTAHGTEQNPTHVYDQAWGTRQYTVLLTATNAGGSDVFSIESPLGMDPPEITVVITGTVGASIVSLYPDPLSIDVDWNISKKYWLATVVIGGNYALPASTDHPTITITVPDHEMANQTIFYGFVASASHKQKFSEDTTTLICYSFDFYLSNQNVPIRSTIASWSSGGGAVFATPDEVIKRFLGTSIAADNWAYTTGINPYNIDTNAGWGDPLTWYALLNGAVDNDDTEFAFDNAEGTLAGTSNIWRGTEMLTTSDTATPLTVSRAQGGTTAIAHPDNSILIKLNTSITAPQKGFVWTPTTKKRDAITELEEYNDFLFYCYWKSLTGEWTPVAYWIAGDDIDTAMDLPAQVTIPITDPNLLDAINADEQNDAVVNRVIIWGNIDPMTNLRYYAMVETATVTAHTVKPKEYTETDDKYNSQSAVNDRADLVLEQMSLDGISHSMPLNKRNDLRPYQLITVTDADNVLEVDMRIIGIHHSIKNLADMTVTISFISDRKFTAARKLKRVSVSSQWSEVNELIADWYSRILLADMVDISEFESGSGVAKNTYGDYVPVSGSNS